MAEAEIVAAAEALLRERPFRELTVDEVMRRTDLSRPSFYVYFRDRHHLILRVVEHLGNETIVNMELASGQHLIVALDGDTDCSLGQTLSVGFTAEKAALFDQAGERITG